jgi:hypothetical protein
MDDNFPHLVTFYDTNEKSRALRQRVLVPDVELSSRALPQGMAIWHMINASPAERQKQAGNETCIPLSDLSKTSYLAKSSSEVRLLHEQLHSSQEAVSERVGRCPPL